MYGWSILKSTYRIQNRLTQSHACFYGSNKIFSIYMLFLGRVGMLNSLCDVNIIEEDSYTYSGLAQNMLRHSWTLWIEQFWVAKHLFDEIVIEVWLKRCESANKNGYIVYVMYYR